jgi:hypothetical protein
MKKPEDIVWDTITDSAKTRFDYAEFASGLSEFDDGTMADNMLFLTIMGHAQKQSVEAIANDLSNQCLMLGLGGDPAALLEFVADRGRDLPLEIKAANQALAFYEMGLQTPGILVQVRSILKVQRKNEEA